MSKKIDTQLPPALAEINKQAMLVYTDSRELYAEFRQKKIKREDCDTGTNVLGKSLKSLAIATATIALERAHEYSLFKMGAIEGETSPASPKSP